MALHYTTEGCLLVQAARLYLRPTVALATYIEEQLYRCTVLYHISYLIHMHSCAHVMQCLMCCLLSCVTVLCRYFAGNAVFFVDIMLYQSICNAQGTLHIHAYQAGLS